MEHLQVSDVMTSPAVTVGMGASFKEIIRIMRLSSVSGVVVVDEDGHPVGMVTETDLVQAAPAGDARARRSSLEWLLEPRDLPQRWTGLTAADLMTHGCVCTTESATVREAIRRLVTADVNRLPVVDSAGTRFIGVVSRSDLLSAFLRRDKDIRSEIEFAVRTLGANSGVVHVEVIDGVVSLSGHATSSDLCRLIGELALRVDGVIGVDNQLALLDPSRDLSLSSRQPKMEW